MSTNLKRIIADLSLRRKLLLITMIIVSIATCTTLLFLRQQAAQARSEQFVQHALAQARLVAEYAISPLVFDDNKGGHELLAKLALEPNVLYVRIDDVQGKVFAEVKPSGTSVPPLTLAGEHSLQLDNNVLHVVVPIFQKVPLGQLRVGFQLEELQQTMGREQSFFLLVLAGVILLSYFLTLLLQRIILSPLLNLQRHANQIAESHDFNTRLEPPGRDEIGSLYLAFNHLIDRIRQREEDILTLNRSLESKVAERTRELEIARDKADRASSSKSEFLANMSHEIRTPINAITGFTTLALRTALDTKQAGYLERIQTAAQGLLHIINDLLDFSKIEAGHLAMERIPFQLSDVMDNVVASVVTQAERKGLELLVHVAPEVPQQLLGDPMRLGQVLINLCNNAVKFTEHGEVELRVDVEPGSAPGVRLRFAVRDTGIGLTADQAGKLFHAFTQADASTTRKFGGTGLGLVISQRLVSMMNGRIWLESNSAMDGGRGTTFFFVAELGLGDARPAPLLPDDLRGQPALIVDDNANARQILTAQLNALGMIAHAVDSGEAALDALREASANNRCYPLVLMDWKMPGADGIMTTRAIRADPAIAGTPVVIMVTGYGREQAISAPENVALFESVLLKPVTPELLAETLCRALGGNTAGSAIARTAAAPQPGRLPGVRLLLVEDNPINQQLAQELLEQEGAEVQIADNGLVALDILQRQGADYFDAALIDLQMPEMDGYETTRRIRQLQHAERLPLIAMTAHAMREERERCLAAGMKDHIAKPIDPELMVSTLGLWIGNQGLARAAQRLPRKTMAAKPATQVQLPDTLPGIDVVGGLRRCMGDTRLYYGLLTQFRQNYANAVQQLTRLCANKQFAEARFLAHTIKGVAANMNAGGVAASAAQLEDALLSEPETGLPALLKHFSGELAIVCDGLAALVETSSDGKDTITARRDLDNDQIAEQSVDRPEESHEQLKALLQQLATCLAFSDTRAEHLIMEVRGLLAGSEPAWLVKTMAAIDSLDYEAAATCLAEAGVI